MRCFYVPPHEYAGGRASNGSGTPCIDSTHHHLDINQPRQIDREDDSPRPHSANNGNGQHPAHIMTVTNPYTPQHPYNVSYPANQSAPVMSSLRPPAQNSQNQVIQTHIFRTSCDWCADEEDQVPKYDTGR